MGSLQSLLEEQLAALPRTIATDLVRCKLEAIGHGDDERLLASIIDRLIDGPLSSRSEDERDLIKVKGEHEITIKFTDADADRVAKLGKEISDKLPSLIETFAEEAANRMLCRYEREWRAWRPAATAEMDQFRANLETRWGKGFDYLRMLIELSRDIGTDFHRRASRSRSVRRVHLNMALCHLHVRAMQISSEIMTLMENGFADGAMGRWRTLHEVTCVATTLYDGGNALAERYLAHEIVEARKGLLQYQRCHVQLGIRPFSKRKASRIERKYKAALTRFGKEFGGDYGWAAVYLNNPKPTFSQIEEAAGRAMMRSHYKMASQNVHAGTKGIAHRLGSIDRPFTAIAGASNVGFVEPGQNLGLSLLHITMLLLPKRPTLDKIAELKVLIQIQERIPQMLAKSERAIRRDVKRIRKEAAACKSKRQLRNGGSDNDG